MTSPLYQTAAPRLGVDTPRRPPAVQAPVARSILVASLLLGATADALLRDGPNGVGLSIWIALLAANAVALSWRAGRTTSRESALWLAGAVVFAFGMAWRNSGTLQAFDLLATVFCLGMAAISTRDPRAALFARRLRDTVLTAADVAANAAFGVFPLALREALLNHVGHKLSRGRMFVRPILIAGVALLVFGSLLRNADPIFASITDIPSFDAAAVASHVLVTGFFAWIVAGWARAGLATEGTPHRSGAALPFQLDTADISAALGTLTVLFAAFIAAQLGWFFGGERFLRERTGLTAATYARQGFFQMVLVVTLVVPVLVGTRAALRRDRALARLHTILSLPVVGLLGAIIASATLRLKMYVHYYGLTTERFYPAVFMVWLAIVIAWLSLTVLRNWGRPFIAGAVISGLASLLALNVADPDAIVARVNIARASEIASSAEPTLDLGHLATLDGGGVPLAVATVLRKGASAPESDAASAQPCLAARLLLNRWGPTSRRRVRAAKPGAFRYWNRDDAAALRVVGERSAELQALANRPCTPAHS